MARLRTPRYIKNMRKQGISKQVNARSINQATPVLSFLGKTIGTVITALALLAAWPLYWTLIPDIIVTETSLPNAGNPLAAPFVVQNSGYIPLEDVDVSCRINMIKDAANASATNDLNDNYMLKIPKMPHGERSSMLCRSFVGFGAPTIYADAELVVQYSPFPLRFWRRQARFRFVTTEAGRKWLPKALSDPN